MTTYRSLVPATIPEDRPKRIASTIDVPHSGRVASLALGLSIQHDRPSDLRLFLQAPSGRRVLVHERHRGGFGADALDVPALAGESLAGRWTLLVDDVKPGDGGMLLGWTLEVATLRSPLLIDLAFMGGLTESQKQVFREAQERFQRMLVGTQSESLTVRIEAWGIAIDGENGTLGRAGPRKVRGGDGLPTAAVMEFDSADLAKLERSGALANVLIHEMGHCLGFGTLFSYHNLVKPEGFVGFSAMREYGALLGQVARAVPLENDGGSGTAMSHWEEDVFGAELFTGWIDNGRNPISRVSVGAFDDLGYDVSYNEADPYMLGLQSLAAGPRRVVRRGCAAPEFEVV